MMNRKGVHRVHRERNVWVRGRWPAWQAFEREGEGKLGARQRAREKGGGERLAPVFQTMDSAIQGINLYPVDSEIGFRNTYPLNSDLSVG